MATETTAEMLDARFVNVLGQVSKHTLSTSVTQREATSSHDKNNTAAYKKGEDRNIPPELLKVSPTANGERTTLPAGV